MIYFAHIVRLPEEGVTFYMITNESRINTNMVLPNVTQLYFYGKIDRDVIVESAGFDNPQSKSVYDVVLNTKTDLGLALTASNIKVTDDMVLMEVGRRLREEDRAVKAFLLYDYYTKAFPNIVFPWNEMGDLYLEQNKKSEAIECYKQALKLRPENQRAKNALAKLGE